MTKPIGPLCNLDCEYCFYLQKTGLYLNSEKWKMSDQVLEKYIKNYIESQASDTVNFAWQGGEPTLCGIDYFKRVIEFQKKYANGKAIENALQTNGTLLNEDWANLFKDHNFLIGVSIDGSESEHDTYRISRGGKGTHNQVLKGIEALQNCNVDFNTLSCVHKANEKKGEKVYRYLKGLGVQYMQFIPIVERVEGAKSKRLPHDLVSPHSDETEQVHMAEWSVTSEGYGQFLCDIYNRWIRKDVGKIYVQIFDVMLGKWLGIPGGLCIFSKTCGDALALEHNGDLYSCDHFVYEENRLGNIFNKNLTEMVESPQQRKFGQEKFDRLPEKCRKCDYQFACYGGCPKQRFLETGEDRKELNFLCEGYLRFFKYIDPSMRVMSDLYRQRKMPAEIMTLLQEKSFAKKLGLN